MQGITVMQATAQLALTSFASPFRSVSTDSIKVSDRREFWETNSSFLFGTLLLEQQSREPFEANFEYTNVGDLVFCRLSSFVPHRVIRTDPVPRPERRAFVKAVLQTRGASLIEQNGRSTPLRSGEWTIYDAERPYSVTMPRRAELSILLIPRDKVLPRNANLRDLVLRRFPAHRGLGKLIWSLISTTFDQLPDIHSRSSQDVADIVAQMTRLALLDISDERASTNSRDTLRERVKVYISSHLGDPDLSIAQVASAAHCSKRYLHKVFEPENVSISDYILKERLERCRGDLLNPGLADRSITEIAYSRGFNNSNHFSRCFKRAFGISPRELRVESVGSPVVGPATVGISR